LPWTMSDTPSQIKSPAHALGQHTDEILAGIGYKEDRIKRLRKNKIIA